MSFLKLVLLTLLQKLIFCSVNKPLDILDTITMLDEITPMFDKTYNLKIWKSIKGLNKAYNKKVTDFLKKSQQTDVIIDQ